MDGTDRKIVALLRENARRSYQDIGGRVGLSAPAVNLTQDLYVSDPLPQTKRIMVKDEDVCLHCGLCAERCPTAAWDMRQFDLLVPYAGSNGTGDAGRGTWGALANVKLAEHRPGVLA